MKVMAITNFGPGIKVHMSEEPRKNLGRTSEIAEEPRRNLLNINQYSNLCVKRGFGVYNINTYCGINVSKPQSTLEHHCPKVLENP